MSMLSEHWGYVSDPIRTRRFQSAIARSIRPGDRVLDLGCGVGILGALCAQAGASNIVGIDRTDIVDVARETYTRCRDGLAVDVIKDTARRVALDRPVDIIVCDHVGYFALDYGILDLLIDARTRFLAPGGRILPASVDLLVAPVQSAAARRPVDGWAADDVPPELHWIRTLAANQKLPLSLARSDLLAAPAVVDRIDFHSEERRFFSWKGRFVAERFGCVDGLAGFFDCMLCEGVHMTNSPLSPDKIERSQAVFPFDAPIQVEVGDEIDWTLVARPDDGFFAWTAVDPRTGIRQRSSTVQDMLVRAEELLRARPDHAPRPTPAARARALVIGYCDGTRTEEEIGEIVLRNHADLFPTAETLRRFVVDVIKDDTQ